MSHYYNEFNPEAAAMLRQFMKDGLIPEGDVDERSITEVTPDDIKGYTQCHFFAGIAGWQFALQLAGWPTDAPVWTGSCPCQPFSSAGRHKGKEDDRHLWPAWDRLISECRPPVIFGEQVATAITKGWLDDVYEMLEAKGYAVGSAVLPASAVGAPHKRERLWFVADSNSKRLETQGPEQQAARTWRSGQSSSSASMESSDVGNTEHDGQLATTKQGSNGASVCNNTQGQNSASKLERASGSSDVPHTKQQGLERHNRDDSSTQRWEKSDRPTPKGHWDDAQWLLCPDGKARPVEPSIPLLVDGFQHRKPILHAIGNAIVPQVAAEFIGAYMEVCHERN